MPELKMPPERDLGFWQPRKHGKWREVPAPEPALEAPVADSHAHLHMLPDPAWELERCAANGVDFVCEVVDPSEISRADVPDLSHPKVEIRYAAGVHPHNATKYDDRVEAALLEWLDDPRATVVGEIGLDYYYDLSPRDVQREVFRRQIEIAQERNFPIALHLRDAADSEDGNAHTEAFGILSQAGALGPRTLLHCCALPPDELAPWIEADCHIAYGGALTFKNSDAAREGARLVPENRLLLETDSPYMAPEPLRGAACTPAHVIFTAARLAEVRNITPGPARESFLLRLRANTQSFYNE